MAAWKGLIWRTSLLLGLLISQQLTAGSFTDEDLSKRSLVVARRVISKTESHLLVGVNDSSVTRVVIRFPGNNFFYCSNPSDSIGRLSQYFVSSGWGEPHCTENEISLLRGPQTPTKNISTLLRGDVKAKPEPLFFSLWGKDIPNSVKLAVTYGADSTREMVVRVDEAPEFPKVARLMDIVILSSYSMPGDTILASPVDLKLTPEGGTWLATAEPDSLMTIRRPQFMRYDESSVTEAKLVSDERLYIKIPTNSKETTLRLAYYNKWGEAVFILPVASLMHIVSPLSAEPASTKLKIVQNATTPGGLICLGGRFSADADSSVALMPIRGGKPVKPPDVVAKSAYNLVLRMPQDMELSTYTLMAGAVGNQSARSIKVVKVARPFIFNSRWEVAINGTDSRVPLEIWNPRPGSYTIHSDGQFSSGGAENKLRGFISYNPDDPDTGLQPTFEAVIPWECPSPYMEHYSPKDNATHERKTSEEITTQFRFSYLEQQFSQRRMAVRKIVLRGEEYYKASESEDFLLKIRDEALDILEKQKHLVALKDYVESKFLNAYAEMSKHFVDQVLEARCPACTRTGTYAWASYPFLSSPKAPPGVVKVVDARLADLIFDFIKQVLSIVSSADHLTLTVCVVTTPEEGATFTFYPSSEQAPEGRLIFSTDGIYPNVWIGRYKYKISKTGYEDVEGFFDFIDDRSSVLECPLVKKGGGSSIACRIGNPGVKTRCQQIQ
jgi:hypothetical protein